MDYAFISKAITRRRPLTRVPSADRVSSGGGTDSSKDGEASGNLKRTLNLMDLIFYGVGCSVGAGIYSLVGIGAHLAGPSIALSFFLCGVACCFTSLAYAEFAARVPLAGSAYTFTYVSFGELCGWLVGWNLTLGYAVSAAVVARSWAEYSVGFVEGIMGKDSLTWLVHAPIPLLEEGSEYDCCPLSMVIILLCTVVLVTGAKESTRFNTAMTILNLSVLGFVLVAGLGSGSIREDNLIPVFPQGMAGMARGAGLVFFAYLGFDMVSCLSEEVTNPSRNMPIGIIGSLLASMSIYVAASLAVVGMAPLELLGQDIPIVNALLANACCSHEEHLTLDNAAQACLTYSCTVHHPILYIGSRLVSFGAIFGLTTSTFACLMGQPRIFYSMAQDGLLFKVYAQVHPKTGVPTTGTILTGIFTALIACFIDLESLANAISLGTLQVFTFVNAGVIILRTRPVSESEEVDEEEDEHSEQTPLIRSLSDAAVARSMGLVQKSSLQIRDAVSSKSRSFGEGPASVSENGSQPHWLTMIFTLGCILASVGLSNDWHNGIIVVCGLISLASALLLMRLPKSSPPDTFTCPMVPLVPLTGILCNSYMMGSLPPSTWSIITLWLSIGLMFYFGYGIHHSELRTTKHRSDDDHESKVEAELAGFSTARRLDPIASERDGYSSIRSAESKQG